MVNIYICGNYKWGYSVMDADTGKEIFHAKTEKHVFKYLKKLDHTSVSSPIMEKVKKVLFGE